MVAIFLGHHQEYPCRSQEDGLKGRSIPFYGGTMDLIPELSGVGRGEEMRKKEERRGEEGGERRRGKEGSERRREDRRRGEGMCKERKEKGKRKVNRKERKRAMHKFK